MKESFFRLKTSRASPASTSPSICFAVSARLKASNSPSNSTIVTLPLSEISIFMTTALLGGGFCLAGRRKAAPDLRRARRRAGPRLLVGDGRAGRAGEGDRLEAAEPCVRAPLPEVGAGEVERVAELDEHVQGHQQAERVLAPRV